MSVPAPMSEPARPPMRPVVVASSVLMNSDGEVLLGRRSDDGLWEVPGGKVEAESVVDGARREILEETGIALKGAPASLGHVDTWGHQGVAGRQWYVCLVFLWREWDGFPQLLEGKHTQWKWFKLNSLPAPELMNFGTRACVRDLIPKVYVPASGPQDEWDADDEAS